MICQPEYFLPSDYIYHQQRKEKQGPSGRLRDEIRLRFHYTRTCPFPNIMYFVVVSASSPIGPRA